jgi:predicted component of type VI protein secretion system
MRKYYLLIFCLLALAGRSVAGGGNTDASGSPAVSPTSGWVIGGAVLLIGAVGAALVLSRKRTKPGGQPSVWGHLIRVSGNESVTEFPLRGDQIEIGRMTDGDVNIRFFTQDSSVSRVQGILSRRGGEVFFENRSTHGTTVNGRRLSGAASVALPPGAVIEMGTQNAIVFYRPLGSKEEGLPSDIARYASTSKAVVLEGNKAATSGRNDSVSDDKMTPARDGTMHVPGMMAQDTDRTMHVADQTVQVPDQTQHIPDRTQHIPDRTQHIPERTLHIPERTVRATEKTGPDANNVVPETDKTMHAPNKTEEDSPTL